MPDSRHDPTLETLLAERAWLRRAARALVVDEATAADLEQETWLAALRAPPSDASRPRAWLGTVLRHALFRRTRGEGRRSSRERSAARDEAIDDDPTAALRRAELRRHVANAVMALDEPYRSTVILRWFEGHDVPEVARRLDASVSAVRTRLSRAHARLRARLDDQHGGRRAAWLAPLTELVDTPHQTPLATTTAGALAMTTISVSSKTKLAVAVALLLAALTGGALLLAEQDSPTVDTVPPRETLPVTTAAEASTPSPAIRDRVEPGTASTRAREPAAHTPMTSPDGRVVATVSAPDGTPVSGVLVVVGDSHGQSVQAVTNPAGRAHLDPEHRAVRVHLRLSGDHAERYLPVPTRTLGTGESTVEFTLVAGEPVRARVLGPDGSALGRTHLHVTERPGDRSWTALTDDDGRVRLLVAQGATVNVKLVGTARGTNAEIVAGRLEKEVVWAGTFTGLAAVDAEHALRATALPTVDLLARVVAPDGSPIPGARVTTRLGARVSLDAPVETDRDGRAVLRDLVARKRSITVSLPESVAGRLLPPAPRVVTPGPVEVVLTAREAVTISGRALLPDGAAAGWCGVEVRHGDTVVGSATSSADGTFIVPLPEDAPAPLVVSVWTYDEERNRLVGDASEVWPGASGLRIDLSLPE